MITNTLSDKPKSFDVTFTTTPRRLRDIIGANLLGNVNRHVPLGGELVTLSGDILWGESLAKCTLPFAAAAVPWDKPVSPILDMYFAAASGTVTSKAVIYLG